MVIEVYKDWRRSNVKVFSNIWLKFPHIPIRTPYDIVDIRDGDALLDEWWALADNRRSMSLKNDVMTIIAIRSRKRHTDIFYTMQYIQIDPRIRFITDYWIRPKVWPDNLSGLPPEILKQQIYDGDFVEMQPQSIEVKPYLNLYDTDKDPYTLSSSVTDERLKEVIEKAFKEEPELEGEMEELKVKAQKKEEA